MQVNERIFHKGVYSILTLEKGILKWIMKKILVTQCSLMAFEPFNSVFEFCDSTPPNPCLIRR